MTKPVYATIKDLHDAVQRRADLRGADLRGADLRRADLMRASLAHQERHLVAAEVLGKTQAAAARRRSIAALRAALREAGEDA